MQADDRGRKARATHLPGLLRRALSRPIQIGRRPIAARYVATFTLLALIGCPGVASARSKDPVPSLSRSAIPLRSTASHGCLRDPRRFAAIVRGARVIGVGEATHGSHQFFNFDDCLLRYLARTQGFRTFSRETDWSGGLRINRYVLTGKGHIRKIMRQEFQSVMRLWNNREYLSLIKWMRAYNARHARKLQFMGDDIELASPRMFDAVEKYVRDHYPWLQAKFAALYRGQRPTTNVGTAIHEYKALPLAVRRDMAARAGHAFELLRAQRPGPSPRRFAWIVQQARVIAQVARFQAFNFDSDWGHIQGDRYRDRAMADNVLWWRGFTSTKVLLSAHNGHVGYVTGSEFYPRPQGSILRHRLGAAYIAIRAAFDAGSFNSFDYDSNRLRRFAVPPAGAAMNEYTLNQVSYPHYLLNLRTVPQPARRWLDRARPSWDIGSAFSTSWRLARSKVVIPLRAASDMLMFVRHVDAARQLSP